jgi:predicted tellurium resistance membrane protein TerC
VSRNLVYLKKPYTDSLVQMYPDPADQAKKLALFGMAGALANTIALVLAGVFLLASWRWYFRFIVRLVHPLLHMGTLAD